MDPFILAELSYDSPKEKLEQKVWVDLIVKNETLDPGEVLEVLDQDEENLTSIFVKSG